MPNMNLVGKRARVDGSAFSFSERNTNSNFGLDFTFIVCDYQYLFISVTI